MTLRNNSLRRCQNGKAAENEELRAGFEGHLSQTDGHVNRLEQVFQTFGEKPKTKKCKGMKGLIEEGKDLIDEDLGDAALISAAQKVEHYEIAAYGFLKTWAQRLGEDDAAELLELTLGEEKATDQELSIAGCCDCGQSKAGGDRSGELMRATVYSPALWELGAKLGTVFFTKLR